MLSTFHPKSYILEYFSEKLSLAYFLEANKWRVNKKKIRSSRRGTVVNESD